MNTDAGLLDPIAVVESALAEDHYAHDLTTHQISVFLGLKNVDPEFNKSFFIVAKSDGVFAGESWIAALAEATSVEIKAMAKDGESLRAGHTVCTGRGPWSKVLAFERTLLNGLQAFSGVATETSRYVSRIKEAWAAKGYAPAEAPGLYHTRKTPPLTRGFVLEAFVAGGGKLHRRHLSERVLVKENHKFVVAERGFSYPEFTRFVVGFRPDALFEVESLAEAEALVAVGARHLMLDNFTPDQVQAALAKLPSSVEIEVSGGLNLDTIADYLFPGVKRLSLGAATHSFRAMDLSLDWVAEKK